MNLLALFSFYYIIFPLFNFFNSFRIVQRFKNNINFFTYLRMETTSIFKKKKKTRKIPEKRIYAKDFVKKNCTVHIRRMPVTRKKAWLSQQLEASASRNNCRRQRRQPSRSKSAPKPWGLDIRSKPRGDPRSEITRSFLAGCRREWISPRLFSSCSRREEGRREVATALVEHLSSIRPVIGNYATTTSAGSTI